MRIDGNIQILMIRDEPVEEIHTPSFISRDGYGVI
jgi:hypothetical protein